MYIAEQNSDGTWRVSRPDRSILKDGLTEQEAARLAWAWNVTFGYLQPSDGEPS